MSEPAAQETLDRLAGDWWIYQLRRGHRYNTDDLATAWTALQAAPEARRVLDLGSGVGSIGLLVLLGAPQAALDAVEVQPASAALARKTLAHNGLEARARIWEMDLRDPALDESGHFDLITANPPYLPRGSAVASPQPQRAAARLELHGDVFDYARVAARHLAARGRLVLCHAAGDDRPARALADAGLQLLCRQALIPRAGRPPLIALYTAGWSGERQEAPPLTVRDEAGQFTEAWRAVRRALQIEA